MSHIPWLMKLNPKERERERRVTKEAAHRKWEAAVGGPNKTPATEMKRVQIKVLIALFPALVWLHLTCSECNSGEKKNPSNHAISSRTAVCKPSALILFSHTMQMRGDVLPFSITVILLLGGGSVGGLSGRSR